VRFSRVDEPTPHPHLLGDRDLAIWALADGDPEVTLQTRCSAPKGCAFELTYSVRMPDDCSLSSTDTIPLHLYS
jgi:hypothetical protein